MIAIKKALYMTVPLLTVITSCVQAAGCGQRVAVVRSPNEPNDDRARHMRAGGVYEKRHSWSAGSCWTRGARSASEYRE